MVLAFSRRRCLTGEDRHSPVRVGRTAGSVPSVALATTIGGLDEAGSELLSGGCGSSGAAGVRTLSGGSAVGVGAHAGRNEKKGKSLLTAG